MVTLRDLEKFLSVVDNDFKYTNNSEDENGILTVIDTDVDYKVLSKKIIDYPPYHNLVIDNGLDYLELEDIITKAPYQVKVDYIISNNEGGIGTVVKVYTKAIYANLNGSIKTFLTKEALDNYIKNNMLTEE